MAARRVMPLLILLLSCVAAQAQGPSGSGAPRFGATFFQPLCAQDAWPRERWASMLDNLASVGVRELVLQWSSFDGMPLYGTPTKKVNAVPLLEKILPLAQERGLTVRVGLAHDSNWWKKIERPAPLVGVYLKTLELECLRVAREVHGRFKTYSCFTGWYLPQELDDVNWNGPRRAMIIEHVRNLRAGLKAIDSGRDVAISGFANGFIPPDDYRVFLRDLMVGSGLEQFYMQDGVGVRKLTLEELPRYLDAAASAVREAGGTLRPVVEIFNQTHGDPVDDKPFKAEPAALSRVEKQLALAGRYAPAGIVAFSLPEYGLPSDDPQTTAFYDGYRRYLGLAR